MGKVWQVTRYEYLRHVLRKRFVLSILSVPFFILVTIGIGVVTGVLINDWRPVGYFDRSGVLDDAQPPTEKETPFSRSIEILRFDSAEHAEQAVKSGEIQAAFIIEGNYMETGAVNVIVHEKLSDNASRYFHRFMLFNLLIDKPNELKQRILEGPDLVFRSLTDEREFHENNLLGILVPLLSGILLVIAVNASGGYLLQAVSEEKENRTIEIIVTSLSPNQLMIGKIFGNLSVGLTQLVFWALTGAGGVALITRVFPDIGGSGLDFSFLGLMLLTFLPAFVMIAALMAMVGATAAEARDAQQIAAVFSIPIAAPLWFLAILLEKPNSALAVGLSLFPLTAPATLPVRAVLTNLPPWQTALSIGLLVTSAMISVWLASRAFRLGMLRYGKSLSLRDLLRRG